MPLVLRDSAPGLPKKGPPWDIEGEPGGLKIFTLKRPFEANNEGDAAGHTGHHKKIPGPTKIPSVQAPPQISNHYSPQVRTCHRDTCQGHSVPSRDVDSRVKSSSLVVSEKGNIALGNPV